ncbi:TraR/DksA C4-type zinc finger protein [Bacillus sp. J33]|uniref:TraR/DksA C4-type zinc finger protein n=1 Tax=Bacillus sp. J33 TaxID=935836 RepID=UPI00047A02D8|nr:TraR/DksA C4-type zinc finger protein [Bacillus sp. J33]
MLTDEQIRSFKKELTDEKHSLEAQLQGNKEESLESTSSKDTVGELSLYDNHPADMGSELYEREKDFALEEHHDSELNKVNAALQAIEDGSYGKCKECGTEIPYDRLEVLPATLYCKKHSPEQNVPGDRPSEEDVLEPAQGNTFQHPQHREVTDNEDSFQEVARFGTSETPSDLRGDHEDYNSLYNEGLDGEGFTEDYESFIGNDMKGTEKKIYPSKKHEAYEDMLDENKIEAPYGDVPYHQTDGYVDDKE